jgi:hypothetical protein
MVKARKGITFKVTHRFLSGLFGEDVHAKRISSLANATLGVVSSASLAVNTIGQGLALARGRLPKHAIKQVDRLSRTLELTSTNSRNDGLPMRSGRARILLSPWTGPTSMPITKRRSCWRWLAAMAGQRP